MRLADGHEILFRQIHPDLVQDGEPSSSNFRPKEADANKLSVDRAALPTPQGAYDLFTSNGFASVAVYGVSVGEFERHGISYEDDALDATDTLRANPAHALANYEAHGTSKQRMLAKRTKKVAIARGVFHAPSTDPALADSNGGAA